MFDSVRCEHPLPDDCQLREYQTKSLGCTLTDYTLTLEGRLLDAQGADTGFHGVMRFYARDDARGAWHEYEAKFTDGRLVHLLPLDQGNYDEDGLLRRDPRLMP